MEEIMSLMQEDNVQDYCDAFETLFHKVNICEVYAVYLFITGLKQEISEALKEYHNIGSNLTLKEAFSLARIQENSLKLDSTRMKQNQFTNWATIEETPSDYEVSTCVLHQECISSVSIDGDKGLESQFILVETAPYVFDEMPNSIGNKIQEPIDVEVLEIQKDFENELNLPFKNVGEIGKNVAIDEILEVKIQQDVIDVSNPILQHQNSSSVTIDKIIDFRSCFSCKFTKFKVGHKEFDKIPTKMEMHGNSLLWFHNQMKFEYVNNYMERSYGAYNMMKKVPKDVTNCNVKSRKVGNSQEGSYPVESVRKNEIKSRYVLQTLDDPRLTPSTVSKEFQAEELAKKIRSRNRILDWIFETFASEESMKKLLALMPIVAPDL
ncbi:hypothetical protein E3N88_08567 [Mikania micrantha]|uniref:Uncharacterized protein n=1 Tax=Mikania micrantha TaxID=192012 RepID=A0A5N6PII0_9ASTR|nr:hypothetical protein E3N88_08567 [Mikania micrantha]